MSLGKIEPEKWDTTTVETIADLRPTFVSDDCDLTECLRLLVRERPDQMLLVTASDRSLTGILTKTDILRAVGKTGGQVES